MSENLDKSKTQGPAQKKPYVKPEFRHERVFEVMALLCGKMDSTQQSCITQRKAS